MRDQVVRSLLAEHKEYCIHVSERIQDTIDTNHLEVNRRLDKLENLLTKIMFATVGILATILGVIIKAYFKL